ncbi:MAG: DUF2250 domain-containing protein [Candidatus Bathyarchaeota archaeon]|nr:DUF2250 domain-containing protein [Candidatus Bathyarchaeota archaeon]
MEEITQVLKELGLTQKQAKILLTLNKFEYATVKDISEAADVHRQEVYQVLTELQKMGLIEKRIGTPNQYKSTTISETLNILLQRKKVGCQL